VDRRVVMVENPLWETNLLPIWVTKILLGYIGINENTSLAKREC
jgi:hypothetical protein